MIARWRAWQVRREFLRRAKQAAATGDHLALLDLAAKAEGVNRLSIEVLAAVVVAERNRSEGCKMLVRIETALRTTTDDEVRHVCWFVRFHLALARNAWLDAAYAPRRARGMKVPSWLNSILPIPEMPERNFAPPAVVAMR